MLRPRRPRPPGRHPDHGPRQADLRGQSRRTSPRSRRIRSRPPASGSSAATSPTRRSSAPLVADADAVVNFAAESHVDRSILDPGGVPADRRHRRPRPARGRPGRVRRPRSAGRFLQVSTDEVYGSVAEGRSVEVRPARPALAVRGRQGRRRAARPELRHDPRDRRRRDPRLEHVRPVSPPGEAHPAVRHERDRRPAAAALRRRSPASATGCTSPTTPRRSTTSCATARRGETYNIAGLGGDDESRRRRGCSSSGSASRGRWSAASRTGRATTAATRWTGRSSRRSAGARTTFEEGLAATVDWYLANEAWWRAARSGRLGRAGTSASTAGARLRRVDGAPELMRVAVTGARRPARPGARDRPRRCAVHRPGRADRLDPRGVRPRRTRRRRGAPRPRPARGRRPRRGLDRRRRLCPRAGAGDAPQRRGDRRARRGLRATRDLDLVLISTNEVFDGQRGSTVAATRPDDPADAGATRTAPRSWPASGARTAAYEARPRCSSGSSGRPGCSGPGAPDFPAEDPRRRRAGQGGRRAAPRRRRRVGHADLRRGRRRGDRRARSPSDAGPPGSTTSSTAAREPRGLGPRRRRAAAASRTSGPRTSRRRPGSGRRAAALGRPGADAAAVRRAAPAPGRTRWPTTRRAPASGRARA